MNLSNALDFLTHSLTNQYDVDTWLARECIKSHLPSFLSEDQKNALMDEAFEFDEFDSDSDSENEEFTAQEHFSEKKHQNHYERFPKTDSSLWKLYLSPHIREQYFPGSCMSLPGFLYDNFPVKPEKLCRHFPAPPPLEKNPGLHSQDPVLTFFVDITSTKLSLKHFPVPTSPTQSYHDNHTPAHQVTAYHLILQFPLYLMASYHHFLLLFNLSVCVLFISLCLAYHASRSSSDITVSVPLYFFLTSYRVI